MGDVQHGAVRKLETPGEPVAMPSVAAPDVRPTSLAPEPGGTNPQHLARKSVAEASARELAVGPEASEKATTMRVSPSAPGEPPHLYAPGPAAGESGGGVKGALKEAWHGIKEITPGTKEHKKEFSTGVTMGGYRTQMGGGTKQ